MAATGPLVGPRAAWPGQAWPIVWISKPGLAGAKRANALLWGVPHPTLGGHGPMFWCLGGPWPPQAALQPLGRPLGRPLLGRPLGRHWPAACLAAPQNACFAHCPGPQRAAPKVLQRMHAVLLQPALQSFTAPPKLYRLYSLGKALQALQTSQQCLWQGPKKCCANELNELN